MTIVEQAEKLVLAETKDFGVETIAFENAVGRVLAEAITADRDMPPFNRVMMDGIAISFKAIEQGVNSFKIKATQAAGDQPVEIVGPDECIEIMTGAALSVSTDTIVPYESIEIKDNRATIIKPGIIKGQSLHRQGRGQERG